MSNRKSSNKGSKMVLIIMASITLLILLGLIGYVILSGKDDTLSKAKQRGSEYLLKENYTGAKEEYKKALELEPDNLVLYFQLAEALRGLEDYNEAATYLEQAIKMAESELELHIDQYVSMTIKLAECYSNMGEDHKREELLKISYEITGSERIKELLQEY